jgi:hypothetical protein
MLTINQLRQVAARTGARDIGNVEIDVILTHLLQLFSERGIIDHLAFKGGTMLRKMVFGPRGRLSTDLDFTRRSGITTDDLLLLMMEALSEPYHGISFRFDRDKDWYLTEEGCAANPDGSHCCRSGGGRSSMVQAVERGARGGQDHKAAAVERTALQRNQRGDAVERGRRAGLRRANLDDVQAGD